MTTSAALAAVVVGYDATPHGDAALDWGVRYATDHGRPLLVVHAAGHAAVHDTFSSVNAKRKKVAIFGRRVTDQALVRALKRSPRLHVDARVLLETPEAAILDAAAGAHLLVVGSRGRGTLASLILGSVSVGVSAHAPCPVVVVRPEKASVGDAAYVGRVVVGVDGSEVSVRALDFAFELAATELKPLAVVHAGRRRRLQGPVAYDVLVETLQEHESSRWPSRSPGTPKSIRTSSPPITWTGVTHFRALVAASAGADTVVVGSRGLGDVAAVVLGSVSRFVVEHASCPVIVVRSPV